VQVWDGTVSAERLSPGGKAAPRVVTADDLERELAAVSAAAAGPSEGVFGPKSVTWMIDREAATFLGAGRALLLQLAHPWVAAGIAEHSRTLADSVGRFHRTFEIVFGMVFGTLDGAQAVARRLHRRHAVVRGSMPETVGPFPAGSSYLANDLAALTWVQATLAETALVAHELVRPPLPEPERERYWAECRLFAALFGVPAGSLPADWAGFVSYNAAMHRSPVLTVSPAAREVAARLLRGGAVWLRVPAWYEALTAHLLPEPVREGFGLRYGPAQRRTAERAVAVARRLYPVLPARVRFVGPYQEATARLAGRRPGRAVRLLNRAWIGRATLP
jgi:uncharacterized protein (DUF2236 family)